MKIHHVCALCCAQLCPTLCSPIDCSQQVSSICEIFQATILQGIVVSFSRGSSDVGIKPLSPALTGGFFTNEPSGKPKGYIWGIYMKFNNNLKWYTAAAKSLQSCRTLCDPIDSSHQAPPSLGFSRQEHWSGLPFPSPMQESEKWKWSRSVMSDSSRFHGLEPTRLLHPWDFPGKSTGVGCHCLLRKWYTSAYN